MSENLAHKHPVEAFMTAETFEVGMGSLVVSRFRAGETVETGIFLLDTYCLGVKSAEYLKTSLLVYQERILPSVPRAGSLEKIEPACARKLVEQAVNYALRLGFSPHRDYRKACRVFGGISAASCASDFVFGFQGKPFYVPGPYDSVQEINVVLSVLDSRCGPGNYACDLLPALDLEESLDD